MLPLNQIIHGDCLEVMKSWPDKCVDLVLTSPPYDELRTYEASLDWSFEIFTKIANELFRITKDGGVIVWVVGDATVKGSETGTSFKQALYFKETGFNLHDTMIYRKNHFAPYDPKCNRYYQEFEYMFILSKDKPATCNYIKEKSASAGKKLNGYSRRPDGSMRLDRKEKTKDAIRNKEKIKANIWNYSNNNSTGHPAPFPERLAEDHILSWSNEGDIILDPFGGSCTTAVAAENLKRKWICIEKEAKYVKICHDRMDAVTKQLF